jgi:N-acetylneuraminic acid mutarotase
VPSTGIARASPSAIAFVDRIIVAGGFNSFGTALNAVEAYDLNYNRWATLPPMPTARGDAAMSLHGESLKIDVFGGAGSRGRSTNVVEQYNPDAQAWSHLTTMPQGRRGLAVVHGLYPGNMMMVAGGIGPGHTVLRSVLEFNAWKHTWSALPSMHTARYDFALVAGPASTIDGAIIYAIGGFGADHKPLSSVEAYDPSKRRWSVVAPLPAARGALGAVVTGGTIVVAGGVGPGGMPTASVEQYGASGRWSPLPAMPLARSGLVLVDTSKSPQPGVWAIGGRGAGGVPLASVAVREEPFPANWSLDTPLPSVQPNLGALLATDGTIYAWARDGTRGFFSFDAATHTWSARAPLPDEATAVTAIAGPQGAVYVVGGIEADTGTGDARFAQYDPATNAWTRRAPIPVGRGNAGGVLGADGRIYVTGGAVPDPSEGDNVLYTRGLEIYDPATDRWTAGAAMPTARERLGMAVMPDGTIAAMGGITSHYQHSTCWSRVELYDPRTDRWTVGAPLAAALCDVSAARTATGTVYAMNEVSRTGAGGGAPGAVESLAPRSHLWRPITRTPLVRQGAGATLGPNGSIYFVGGQDADGEGTATVQRFALPSVTG